MKKRRWTDEELRLLREQYGREGLRGMAKRLGRSEGAIKGMADRLGLRRERGKWSPWSADDDAFLMLHYANKTLQWIAERLGRTRGAVAKRLHVLRHGRENPSRPIGRS